MGGMPTTDSSPNKSRPQFDAAASRARRTTLGSLAGCGLLAAALLLAACGGSSASPKPSSASAADNALKFSRCMREHGVKNFPNPETTSNGATKLQFKAEGTSPKTMEAAQQACRKFQEEGGEGPELSPQQKVEQEEAVQKFAKCMREHGIEVEASTSGGGVQVKIEGGPGAGGPNPRSPAFQEAQEACQGLMPGPKVKGGGPPPQTSTSPGGGEAQSFSSESGE